MLHVVTNEAGGQQTHVSERLDLVDGAALLVLGAAFAEGATPNEYRDAYPEGNWRKIEAKSHLNHALIHIAKHLSGDRGERHAAHAQIRIHMWIAKLIEEGQLNLEGHYEEPRD